MKARVQPKKNVVLLSPHRPAVVAPTSKTKSADWRKIGRGAVLIGIVLASLSAGYGLFGTAYFRATSLTIQGTKLLNNDELRQQASTVLNGAGWRFWQNNFWLASTDRFCQTLQNYNLADCQLRRHWPNKLIVEVQEEPTVAIWQENGWYYWVDRLGRVIKQELPNPASAKQYPVINNTGSDSLVSDRQITQLDPSFWQLIAMSQTNWLGQAPKAFNFNRQEPNSLQAIIDNQQVIKLTLRRGLSEQLKLWQAGQGKFAQQLSQAKVIDLRYGDRIIYQ